MRQKYETDLTDEQWEVIAPLFSNLSGFWLLKRFKKKFNQHCKKKSRDKEVTQADIGYF